MNKPFMLKPAGKDYLWGGIKLKEEFGKNIDMSPLAETWECSTHPDGPSLVASGEFKGQDLTAVLKSHPEYLGTHLAGACELPILVKLIDAKQDLSVQVHPDDEYAMEHENGQLGKTEMWYVLSADEDASLVYGFNKDMTKDMVREAAANGTLSDHLQRIPVRMGDTLLIEAGTVHGIGAGIVIAEIQENSNLTYRLYDYDRVGKDGKKRELHIDKALAVANLKKVDSPRKEVEDTQIMPGLTKELLASNKYFEVYHMILNTQPDCGVSFMADEDSFRTILCVEGEGCMKFGSEEILFAKGDCIFVPASSVNISLYGNARVLDIKG